MRRLLVAFLFLLASVQGSAASPEAEIGANLERLAAAQASGDTSRAAQIAHDVAALDFSCTPLRPSEVRTLRASFAEVLADGGRLSEAIALLDRVTAEDRSELEVARDPETTSELRLAFAGRLERLGDLQIRAGLAANAANTYALALGQERLVLGESEPQTRFLLRKLVQVQRRAGLAPDATEVARLEQLASAAQAESMTSLGPGENNRAYETIRVFFGTSRNAAGPQDPERAYGGLRGNLSLGSVMVTVPRNRAVGSIPRPGWFDLNGAQDGVHIVLKRIDRDANEGAFRDRLTRSLSENAHGQHDAFVYVHGYNETFAEAVSGAAQLAVDLDMRNGAIVYSWPAGDLLSYQVAQNNVEPSVDGLVTVLRLATSAGAEHVHLIAHSMGNRVLLAALDRLRQAGFSTNSPAFGQIIFASPDVDASAFVEQVRSLRGLAQGMTLYASSGDRALQLSEWLGGGYPRAGQVPFAPAVARSVIAVDTSITSQVSGGDFVRHSDYATGAINDVRAVVWLSLAPQSRCVLVSRGDHWQENNSVVGCEGNDFRRAISAIRLYGGNAQAQIESFIQQIGPNDAQTNSWRTALAIVRRIRP